MESWARKLASLGFSEHTFSETIVVSQGPAGLVAAPMGILLKGNSLLIQPYRKTRTYTNLVNSKNCTINITRDSLLFYKAIMKKLTRKDFAKSKVIEAPRLRGTEAIIEAVLLNILENDVERTKLLFKPVYIKVFKKRVKAYNRADSLLIEALVYYTKLQSYMEMGRIGEVKKLVEKMEMCRETIYRASVNKKLRSAINRVLSKAKGIEAGLSSSI